MLRESQQNPRSILSKVTVITAMMSSLCLIGGAVQAGEAHSLRINSNVRLSSPVAREVSDGTGGLIRIEVLAPEGKKVDSRVFEQLLVERQGIQDVSLRSDPPASQLRSNEVLDVSGYHISVTARSVEAACSSSYVIRWTTGFSLSPNQSTTISLSGSPEQLQATTYPQGGDVNLYLYAGNTLLASSTQPPTYLDTAGVINTSCQNDSTSYNVVISNPSTTSSARFVGVVTQVMIQ